MDFMKWGYLVRKIQVHTHWVYTFIGKDGYTYIITPMTGGNKVTVLYQNNIIHKFIDVFQTSHMIFNRYIERHIPGEYTTIHYHNKTPNLLTSLKYKSPLNVTPLLAPYWLSLYQSCWNMSMSIIRRQRVRSKWFNRCERMLDHILSSGYFNLIDTGLTVGSIKTDKERRDITIKYHNNSLMYRNMYIGLFYALKSNLVLNSPAVWVGITFAHGPLRNFTLHRNILFNHNTTLSKFLDWTEPNYIYLMRENYLDNLIPLLEAQMWYIDIPLNSHIKIHEYGKWTISPKSYSTLASSATYTPISDPIPFVTDNQSTSSDIKLLTVSNKYTIRNLNNTHFTPINPSKKVTKMGIIALDIETMNHPDPENDNQVPTVVTISHLEQLDPTLKLPPVNELFHLNKAIWGNKGLNYAVTFMWKEVFDYLSFEYSHAPTKSNVIFAHNLGGFDGDFILKALLLIFGKDNVESMLDKEHKFIMITAKVNKVRLVFKDSKRLFNVSLEDLCQNFQVPGKISKYNKDWQDIRLITSNYSLYVRRWQQLIKYAQQDSLGLLLAMIKGQEIYTDIHQVDICSIWSTATLSLKIYRLKYLKHNIPSLNKDTDHFVR